MEDEPNRKAMGCRKAPTAVRAGNSQHGRGRVGTDEDEPNRKAMGCRKAPTAVRAGGSQHGRGRVGTDEVEPSRKAMVCRRAPTAVRAGNSQHGRGRVGTDIIINLRTQHRNKWNMMEQVAVVCVHLVANQLKSNRVCKNVQFAFLIAPFSRNIRGIHL